MKIAVLSDTHYGYDHKTQNILQNFLLRLYLEDFDIIVHCGDWISHQQNQWEPLFKLIRTYFETCPIIGVLGNHDFWDWPPHRSTYESLMEYIRIIWKKYNIQYLPENPYINNHVEIYGYNGWYDTILYTNDQHRIALDVSDFNQILWKVKHNQISNIMIHTDVPSPKKRILVTHHNVFVKDLSNSYNKKTKHQLFIINKFDILFEGHVHCNPTNIYRDSLQIINPGSDYNMPNYKIIDL